MLRAHLCTKQFHTKLEKHSKVKYHYGFTNGTWIQNQTKISIDIVGTYTPLYATGPFENLERLWVGLLFSFKPKINMASMPYVHYS